MKALKLNLDIKMLNNIWSYVVFQLVYRLHHIWNCVINVSKSLSTCFLLQLMILLTVIFLAAVIYTLMFYSIGKQY